MILEFRPQLQPVRDTVAYQVIWKLAFSGILIYLTYFRKKKQTKGVKILMSAVACIPWLAVLAQNYKAVLSAVLVLQFFAIGYLVYSQLFHKKNSNLLLYTTMFLILFTMTGMGDYTFVNNSNGFQFWKVSLAVSVMAAVAITVLVVKGYWKLKDDRVSEKVCLCILVTFFAFMISESALCHINYICDRTVPSVYELTVEDKELETHSKGETDYILKVRHKGRELEMEVSQSDYYQYEIGDELPVTFYEGFFEKEFYIVE